jgi:hypothetical protein
MSKKSKQWMPEIEYEEGSGGVTSSIPFISVPLEEEMPRMLFIFESRDTGEVEPGQKGEEVPVVELNLHQYVDMAFLKAGLTPTEYDRVRFVLGLDPLTKAAAEGKKITDNIRKNVEKTDKKN